MLATQIGSDQATDVEITKRRKPLLVGLDIPRSIRVGTRHCHPSQENACIEQSSQPRTPDFAICDFLAAASCTTRKPHLRLDNTRYSSAAPPNDRHAR